jgi:folate-dependent phosphoribosylglycinamide formyltransferase PurN
VTDDDEEQWSAAWRGGVCWPLSFVLPIRDETGSRLATLGSMTVRIPAQPWKDLRRASRETVHQFHARKARAKRAYERRIDRHLTRAGTDLIVVDSYLTIIGPELLDKYAGRILNVHPAITEPRDAARLPGRTPTRDAFTRATFGYIVVDDKRTVGIPAGERVYVDQGGALREVVLVERIRETGVTVHVVTSEIDGGPVVACERYTIANDELSFEGIRRRNAQIRSTLVPRALLAYVADRRFQAAMRTRRQLKATDNRSAAASGRSSSPGSIQALGGTCSFSEESIEPLRRTP